MLKLFVLATLWANPGFAYRNECSLVLDISNRAPSLMQQWLATGRRDLEAALDDGCRVILDPDNQRCSPSEDTQKRCRTYLNF